MIAKALQQKLAQVIQQQQVLMNDLSTLLTEELSAISGNNIDALEQITPAKNELVNKLQPLSEQFQALLKQAGQQPDKQGIRQVLLNCAPEVSSQWQALLTVTARCHRQNLINGRTIEISYAVKQRSLELLLGINEQPELYNPDGKASSRKGAGPLAKA